MRVVAVLLSTGLLAAGGYVVGRAVLKGDKTGGGSATTSRIAALDPFSAIPKAQVDQDHDGLDDNFEQRIAEKYAPELFLEAQEKTYPASVPWLLGRMQLQHTEDGCTPDHRSELTSHPGATGDQLLGPDQNHQWTFPGDFTDVGPRFGCRDDKRTSLNTINSLPDGPDATGAGDEQVMQLEFTGGKASDMDKAGQLDPSQWPTYVHVYPSAQHGVIVQYWHAFPYNPVPGDTHEGDWDASLQVRLDAQLNLVGAWFSRHSNDTPGRWIPASKLSTFAGSHIEEAIDSGGHGAYASPKDWCAHPDTVNLGVEPHLSIVWPQDTSQPMAASLHHQNCSLVGVPGRVNSPDSTGGGVVWQTWSGGRVTQQGDNLAQRLDNQDSASGPLINVGECNLGHQTAQLDQGHCYPLNNQTFIEYSGQWGTTRAGDVLPKDPTSPRGPLYQGYDKDSQTYKSFYSDGADSPYQVPNFPTAPDGPIQRIVFVHGINANCNTIARGSEDYGNNFVAQLQAKLNAEVDIFCYDHDLGYSKAPNKPAPGPLSRNCGSEQWSTSPDHIEPLGQQQNLVTDTDATPLSVSGLPGQHNLCDGNGPLAYDSTRLEDYLYELYQRDLQHHDRPLTTAVIGNSMGGAITRGWTHVALERRSPTIGMVSTVLYVQGALQGSWIAGAGQTVNFLTNVPGVAGIATLLEKAGGLANLDASRPGVKDLAPQSDWYHSVADIPGPQLHYFSIYSDITFGNTQAGDGVMLPGDPKPFALPPEGGARYLPTGPQPDQHEYAIPRSVSSVTKVIGDPASHFSLGQHIGQVTVASCASPFGQLLIPDEIARVLANPPHACTAGGPPKRVTHSCSIARGAEGGTASLPFTTVGVSCAVGQSVVQSPEHGAHWRAHGFNCRYLTATPQPGARITCSRGSSYVSWKQAG
jgi:hypothetical protein